MTSTEIATTETTGLAIVGDTWSDSQLAALAQIGVEHATTADLDVFRHVCQRTGLDPFARQIYMIQREGKQTIQTGIDGFRLVARRAVDRSREPLSISAPEWCDTEGNWTEVWLSSQPPAAARVTVTRGERDTFPAIALWREYVQTKRDGNVTRMWATRPAGQLAKCAEALALRKAFPQDLAGLYTADEMAADSDRVDEREERTTLRDVLAQDDTVPGEIVVTEVEQLQADVDNAATMPKGSHPTGRAAAAKAGEKLEQERQDRVDNPDQQPLDARGSLGRRMWKVIRDAGISDDDSRAHISKVVGREIKVSKDLTNADALAVIAQLEQAQESGK